MNGTKYEGSWKDNKRHGTGTIKYYNFERKLDMTWKGEFVENKRHKGKLIFPDGKEVDANEDTFDIVLEELKKFESEKGRKTILNAFADLMF